MKQNLEYEKYMLLHAALMLVVVVFPQAQLNLKTLL